MSYGSMDYKFHCQHQVNLPSTQKEQIIDFLKLNI